MKHIKNNYIDHSGGPTETKSIRTQDVSCVTHQCGFLKNMYCILNTKKLMIDAQWEPPRDTTIHPNENTNEKNYSEVTSCSWYRRTYEKMKSRHEKKILIIHLCLLR